jgi:hypothetical protein
VSSEWRGAFGSALGFSMSLGLQYVILVGEVVPDWRITTVACIVPVILGVVLLEEVVCSFGNTYYTYQNTTKYYILFNFP